MTASIDIEKALVEPNTQFSSPMAVVDTPTITFEQKLEILKTWESQARGLEVASNEGMEGQTRSRLTEVGMAITELTKRESVPEPETKYKAN
jgi:hypothetical protein